MQVGIFLIEDLIVEDLRILNFILQMCISLLCLKKFL